MTNFLNTLIGTGCQPELAKILSDHYGSGSLVRTDGQIAWDVDAQGDFVQDATYGGSIELTKDNTSVAQSYAAAVTAAGSTISDATQLAKVNNNVTVTGSAGVGVKLFDGPIGTTIRVRNERSLPVNVYPPTASIAINSFANGAPIIISYNDYAEFTKISATQWIAQMGSALDASGALTAAGTIITDALDLFNPINNVTTVAAGTGVQLYEAAIGTRITVRNGGSNALQVYPPSASGTINNLSAGVAFILNSQAVATFCKATATAWVSELGCTQGFENSISAAGTIITDATDLSRLINNVTTVAAGTGVQLFQAPICIPVEVRNSGALPLLVYPPDTSSNINAGTNGAAVTINPGDSIGFYRLTATAWLAHYKRSFTSSLALTAAGSAIGDALQLSNYTNSVTTVAAGTGVKLFDGLPGTTINVINLGANDLLVYPPAAGSFINAGADGAAITLTAANDQAVTLVKVSATQWAGTIIST